MSNEFVIKLIKNRIEKNKRQISFFQIKIQSFLKDDNLLMVIRYQKVIEKLRQDNFNLNFELDNLSKKINKQDYCLLEENNSVIVEQPSINKWNEKIYKTCEENIEIENTNWKCMSNGCSIS